MVSHCKVIFNNWHSLNLKYLILCSVRTKWYIDGFDIRRKKKIKLFQDKFVLLIWWWSWWGCE
jgi:hypothetical protein